jgi:ribosomal protein S4
MLMRAQCLKSAAAAYQFIKYGCACINFKVMTYPNAPVKVGDVVTLQMPMQITHAFFSRLYGEKKKH